MTRIWNFNQLVYQFALKRGAEKTFRTPHTLHGTKRSGGWIQVFSAPRWRPRFFGRRTRATVPEEHFKAFSNQLKRNRHGLGGPPTPQQKKVMAEVTARHDTVELLREHLDGDSPLTQRVLQDYKALYGRDLKNTYVAETDLRPLLDTAERVRETVREERRGVVLVNPRLEATKRALRIATDTFRTAANKGPSHRGKLRDLEKLQERLKDIGPRADADAVEAMVERRIKEIGLTEHRFVRLRRIKYGVDVDFRHLLKLARASVDQELSGKLRMSEREKLRYAVGHTVAKLKADVAEIDRKIEALQRDLKTKQGIGRTAKATTKDIKRDIKHLKAARDTIEKTVLPDLSTRQIQLDYLRIKNEKTLIYHNQHIEDTLEAADAALARHASALSGQGVRIGFARDPAENARPSPCSTLYSRLKDDEYGILAAKLDPKDTVAKRLEATMKGRHWLLTSMRAGNDHLYRSQPVETPSQRKDLDADPNLDDTRALREEMQRLATVGDGADGLRRKILRLGLDQRLGLLREFNASAATPTPDGTNQADRLQELEKKAEALLAPLNKRIERDRAKDFFIQDAWPEEIYKYAMKRDYDRYGTGFMTDHLTLRAHIKKVEAALKRENRPSVQDLKNVKAGAEKLREYLGDATKLGLFSQDRVFHKQIDNVIRHSEVLLS